MKNKIVKDVFNEKYNQNDNYKSIFNRLEKRKQNRKKLKITICTFAVIVILGTTVTYAQEIKDFISNYIYKYETKEEWDNKPDYGVSNDAIGIHTFNVNGFVSINDVKEDINFSSLKDMEEKLEFKLLKNKELNLKYFNYYSYDANQKIMVNRYIKQPAILYIELSNYEDFSCEEFIYSVDKPTSKEQLEKHKKCLEQMNEYQPDKKLSLNVLLATQFSSKNQLNDLNIYLADFPDSETEIYESNVLNNKIFISRWEEYIFILDNIVYIFDNSKQDYSKEEMINYILML